MSNEMNNYSIDDARLEITIENLEYNFNDIIFIYLNLEYFFC